MLTIPFVLSSLYLLAAATPTPVVQDRSIRVTLSRRGNNSTSESAPDIERLQSELSTLYAKLLQGWDAYLNNTGTPHPLAQKLPDGDDIFKNSTFGRKEKRLTDGLEPLVDEADVLWQGAIDIGTTGQTLAVQFDTGSSDLVVPGPNCANAACQGHTKYLPEASTTAVNVHKTFSSSYGTGDIRGAEYDDTVAFAGYTATKQRLGAASSYSTGFSASNFPADGILGMGFQSISRFNSPPVYQTMFAQGQFNEPVFGFRLDREESELIIGGVGNDSFLGNVTFTPVTKEGYWQVVLDAVSVNGTSTPSTNGVESIIDTGTTLIYAPQVQARQVYQTIPGSKPYGRGFYTFPCQATPNVSLTFGAIRDGKRGTIFNGTAYHIERHLFNLGTVDNGTQCLGAIVGSSLNFWVIGDRFLQNVYSIFDFGSKRVGFAPRKFVK